jgi:hypothetical protein
MRPEIFKFYLKKNAGTYYKAGASGVITQTSTPTPIISTPIGWQDIKIEWKRKEEWWGITRSFATPLGFIKEAATILRYIFAAQGIEGVCLVEVHKVNTFSLLYEPFYTGALDFSNHDDQDTRVQENIMEAGVVADLKARENTPFEIEIQDADCITVYNDGIVLAQAESLLISTEGNPPPTGSSIPRGHNMTLTTSRVFQDSPIGIDSRDRTSSSAQYPLILDNFFYKATEKGTVFITTPPAGTDQSFGVSFLLPADYTMDPGQAPPNGIKTYLNPQFAVEGRFYKRSAGGVITPLNKILTKKVLDQGTYFPLVLNEAIPVEIGDEISLLFYLVAPNQQTAFSLFWGFSPSIMRLTYGSRQLAYTFKAYRYHQVWEKVINLITGGRGSGISSFLTNPALVLVDNHPFNTLLTCGDAIRGLPGPKLKITLGDLYKDAFAHWPVGMGTDGDNVQLESIADFFRDNLIADLGDVKEVKMKPATSLMGNLIKVGYANQSYDAEFGRDEFNAGQTYSLLLTRNTKTLDWTSPFRADMYGIELLRANLANKTTADAKSDNDIFLIEVTQDGNGNYVPYRPNNAGNTTGLLFPDSAYNVTLSPAHDLARKGSLLKSIFTPAADIVYFQTADKNTALKTSFGAGIDEGVAQVLTPAIPIYFKPAFFEFEAVLPADMMTRMAAGERGYFSFNWRGHTWKGYTWNHSIKPALRDSYTVQLLAHKSTDLSLAVK